MQVCNYSIIAKLCCLYKFCVDEKIRYLRADVYKSACGPCIPYPINSPAQCRQQNFLLICPIVTVFPGIVVTVLYGLSYDCLLLQLFKTIGTATFFAYTLLCESVQLETVPGFSPKAFRICKWYLLNFKRFVEANASE